MPAAPCERLWTSLDPAGSPRVHWCREVQGSSVVVLLGAFDPPTRAHLSLVRGVARAEDAPAAFCVTKVLLDRPPDQLLSPLRRLELLDELTAAHGLGLAIANRGTYLDVSRALRAAGMPATFVVGSDKLTKLADPSFYPDGERGALATFEEVRFVVIPRAGAPVARADVRVMDPSDIFTDPDEAEISSTEVRRRMRDGRGIDALVPPEVAVALGGYTAAK